MPRNAFLSILLCGVGLWVLASAGAAGSHPLNQDRSRDLSHDLTIELELEEQHLLGTDVVRVPRGEATQRFFLNPRAHIESVTFDDRPTAYTFSGGRLTVGPLPESAQRLLTIRYRCVFDDKAPVEPLNPHDPSYGVSAVVSPHGVMLLGGAHWYPQSARDGEILLSVHAPLGVLAVTSGDLIAHEDEGGRSVSRWRVSKLAESVSLTAGRYLRRSLPAGNVTVATYFSESLQPLSDQYLHAAAETLRFYEDLFGPYAFRQFAVVENFFPTGYGFPGFTLMGGRVLRLPFIIHTSLGHEIAHCWWGNGVQVDYSQGNWSEGLTTYVADYLYEERRSPEAATARRREWLLNYAALVDPADDFALIEFTSRTDPVSKAIGYDKSAMVFHMLRREIGEDAFWGALRDLYARRLFLRTGWSDLQAAFEQASGRELDRFFDQWVRRAGAPRLNLRAVEREPEPGGFIVHGNLVQSEPAYELSVPLELTLQGSMQSERLRAAAPSTRFRLRVDGRPQRLSVDPNADLFRRLSPEEIPPTINHLKSAPGFRIEFLPGLAAPYPDRLADRLRLSLGFGHAERAPKTSSTAAVIRIGSISDAPARGMAGFFTLTPEGFTLDGRAYDDSVSFFGVFEENGGTTAFFAPAGEAAASVAAKLTHYGKYSYLVFQGERNIAKGLWPTERSPLVRTWPD